MQTISIKTIAIGLLSLCLGLAGCNKQQDTNIKVDSAAKKTIIFGTTVGDFGDMAKFSIKPILESKAFQVPTAPLGIYSGKLTNLTQAKQNMRVSVPNDPSNFARALLMMNELGWLTLKDHINPLNASEKDIAENKYHIQLVQLEAAQIPRARNDVDFAIINGNYAVSSGVDLTTALYQEPSFDYVNWGAMRTKDLHTAWAKDVIAAYNSAEFKAYAYKNYAGYKWPANWLQQATDSAKDTH